MKHKSPKRCFFLLSAVFLFLLTGCTSSAPVSPFSSYDKISKTGFLFDTVVSVTLYGTSDETILEECFLQMQKYENLLSKTAEGSDIWKINHSDGASVTVSPETAKLLSLADTYASRSDGAFDVTIAPVVSLWNFSGEEPHTIPDPAEIAEALTHVDYHNLILDGTTVTLSDPLSQVDLGGIAKGFIADCIRDWFIENGISCGLINLGGNILTFGKKPDGSSWNIAVRKPFGTSEESIAVIPSQTGISVVTSGTYERYFEQDGILYHHILDPDNGYPVSNGLTSVTILSASSAEADALSTACFVLGLKKGMELIESIDTAEALFITEDLTLYKSSGFPS